MTRQGILEIKARHMHMAVATSTSAWRCATCRPAGVYSMPIVFNVCDGADHAGQCFLQAVCPKCKQEALLEWLDTMTGIIVPSQEIESILNDPKRPAWVIPDDRQVVFGAVRVFKPRDGMPSQMKAVLQDISDRVEMLRKPANTPYYDPFDE